ncbi:MULTISPECIES: hypothetical protein [unclassified Chamaesiphon]|uniref:hypothetical protein n=1 Tax=unclassified Chamaesiphon TaxID=2620921 RepID=UPI00286CEDE2|nr:MULTISPECIES: hypothetical protein [unclassified Chamaesiphon]
MLDKLIDRVGDTNPQLFRELKERLTPRNIALAIVSSLLLQGLVVLFFNAQLPAPLFDNNSPLIPKIAQQVYSKYCNFSLSPYNNSSSLCNLDGAGGFIINWQKWQYDIFICLSWILPSGLILGSVYTLVADLIQEEKRGTLNFIRLSPQSAQTIFIGKISGVPILVYIAISVMLPLHFWMGMSAKATIPLLASWYGTLGAMWFLLASASVLYVLLGGIQAIVTVIVVAFPLCLPIFAINSFLSSAINKENFSGDYTYIYWYGWAIDRSAVSFHIFVIGCCLVASYGIWQTLSRRYLNPTATIISKYQSYLINFCVQLWIAGFTVPLIFANPEKYYHARQIMSVLAMVDFIALLLLIPMLLPNKQALQDWSRYRREHTQQRRKFMQRDLFQDLIGNDKSPALLTIAINVAMAMVAWIPVTILALTVPTRGMDFNTFSTPGHVTRLLAGICVAASLILIYAAIAHLGLFLKVRKRNLWICAIVSVVMILPVVVAYALSPVKSPTGLAAIVLLFSPFAPIGIFQLAGSTILATFTAQVAMFAALTHQLQRQLKISGRSQSKVLLTQS